MSASLLADVRAFIRRFVVLEDAQADAVTLWAAHTHPTREDLADALGQMQVVRSPSQSQAD